MQSSTVDNNDNNNDNNNNNNNCGLVLNRVFTTSTVYGTCGVSFCQPLTLCSQLSTTAQRPTHCKTNYLTASKSTIIQLRTYGWNPRSRKHKCRYYNYFTQTVRALQGTKVRLNDAGGYRRRRRESTMQRTTDTIFIFLRAMHATRKRKGDQRAATWTS